MYCPLGWTAMMACPEALAASAVAAPIPATAITAAMPILSLDCLSGTVHPPVDLRYDCRSSLPQHGTLKPFASRTLAPDSNNVDTHRSAGRYLQVIVISRVSKTRVPTTLSWPNASARLLVAAAAAVRLP